MIFYTQAANWNSAVRMLVIKHTHISNHALLLNIFFKCTVTFNGDIAALVYDIGGNTSHYKQTGKMILPCAHHTPVFVSAADIMQRRATFNKCVQPLIKQLHVSISSLLLEILFALLCLVCIFSIFMCVMGKNGHSHIHSHNIRLYIHIYTRSFTHTHRNTRTHTVFLSDI